MKTIVDIRILVPGFFLILALALCSCSPSGPVTITSPDGALLVTVRSDGGDRDSSLVYNVSFHGEAVVTDSNIEMILNDGTTFGEKLSINDVSSSSVNESYTIPAGKSSEVQNNFNEKVISLSNEDGKTMDMIFRAYDDGIAFRYRIPEQEQLDEIEITNELSTFSFPNDARYWGLHLNSYTTSYETDYTEAHLSEIPPDDLLSLPVLVEVSDEAWVGLSEANLENYAGMYVKRDALSPQTLYSSLSPLPDSSGILVKGTTPVISPWRVLMVADRPGRLSESNIILNLNDPVAIDDSWIKPGKAAWDWWSGSIVKGQDFEGRMDTRTMKHYIDFASDYDLEYMLVDAGWSAYIFGEGRPRMDITRMNPNIDIPELVTYGAERGVDIIIWLHWTAVDTQMDEAFPLYEEWGVKGVKIDFMDRDDQEMVDFYHRVAKKAAEHKLLVDFHGAYKPDGLRRTYPNVITREGVMGLEYSKWSDRNTPYQNAVYPFTRMLAGPMDYTPGGFNNAQQDQFEIRNREPMTQGTRCHQLALFVIYESPLMVLADYPDNYRGQPGVEFLSKVPSSWDETRALIDEVGELVSFARRRGNEWYMGTITDWTSRDVDIPLDFLGEGAYTAEIFADGPDAAEDATNVSMTTETVSSDDVLHVSLAPGGGHAVRFFPAQ